MSVIFIAFNFSTHQLILPIIFHRQTQCQRQIIDNLSYIVLLTLTNPISTSHLRTKIVEQAQPLSWTFFFLDWACEHSKFLEITQLWFLDQLHWNRCHHSISSKQELRIRRTWRSNLSGSRIYWLWKGHVDSNANVLWILMLPSKGRWAWMKIYLSKQSSSTIHCILILVFKLKWDAGGEFIDGLVFFKLDSGPGHNYKSKTSIKFCHNSTKRASILPLVLNTQPHAPRRQMISSNSTKARLTPRQLRFLSRRPLSMFFCPAAKEWWSDKSQGGTKEDLLENIDEKPG